MNRFVCGAGFALVAASIVLAQDAAVNDLKNEKTALEAKRKELQGQYDKAKAALLASNAFASEKVAAEKAEKALQERKLTDKDLAKARASVGAAQQELADLIAKKADATKEVKAAVKELSDLEAKAPELRFRKRLLQVNLNHEGSPVQAELATDKALIEAQGVLAAAEQAAMANPSEQIVAARKALAKAMEALRKPEQEVAQDKSVRKTAEAVAAATAEAREAEIKDKARIEAAKLREELAKVRQEAIQRTSSAKQYSKELDEIAAARKEMNGQRRGLAQVMDVNRKAIREGKGSEVTKAAAAVEKARKAFDKECDTREIGKARKAAEEAAKAFDVKHDEMFANIPEYKQLTAKIAGLEQTLSAMDKDALAATSAKAIRKLAPEIQKIAGEIAEANANKREIRISTGKDKWDAIYRAKGEAAGALKAAVAASEDAAAASAALAAAEAALAKAVDSAMAETKAGAACLELQKELAAEARQLAFRESLASLHLNDPDSPVKMAIDKDSKLVKAAAELNEREKELREKPSNAIVKTRKAQAEAQAEAAQARAKAEQADDFRKAVATRQAAEQELRKAEAADPAKAKIDEAKKALDAKRAEALAGIKAAKKLMGEIKEIDDEVAAIQTAKAKVAELQKQARTKVDTADDKDIAAAKKAIDEARASLKKAEEAKVFQELQKGIQEARAALDQAKKDAEAKDKGLLAIRKQIDGVSAEITTVAGKIREAEKKAAEAKKQAETKPPAAK
jgi:hypothetical protein